MARAPTKTKRKTPRRDKTKRPVKEKDSKVPGEIEENPERLSYDDLKLLL